MTIQIDGHTRTVSDRIADSIIRDAESGALGQQTAEEWSTLAAADVAALRPLGYIDDAWGSDAQIAAVIRTWASRQIEARSRAGRQLGSARSERKAAAARANGKQGGRPRYRIILDNSGGITLQIGTWAHYYDGQRGNGPREAAECIAEYERTRSTEGWDGHEDEAAACEPTADEIRMGGYRIVHRARDLDPESAWANERDLAAAIRR